VKFIRQFLCEQFALRRYIVFLAVSLSIPTKRIPVTQYMHYCLIVHIPVHVSS